MGQSRILLTVDCSMISDAKKLRMQHVSEDRLYFVDYNCRRAHSLSTFDDGC